MRNNKLSTAISTILITSALAACGGGSDTTTGTAAKDVISSGAITEFGSVWINGVHYETDSAKIISADDGTVLDNTPDDKLLQAIVGKGQVITVRGTRNDDSTGTATSITFDNELAGEVTSVSVADASFVILGQTISITPDTFIDDSLIEALPGSTNLDDDVRFSAMTLPAGQTLEDLLLSTTTPKIIVVSGFPSQNGFEATRIEDRADIETRRSLEGISFTPSTSTEVEVKGRVSSLDTPPGTFKLNGLSVTYQAAVLDDDFSGSVLTEGMYVEVHGDFVTSTSITANRIEREDNKLFSSSSSSSSSSGELEIEGVIQKVVADATGTGGLVTINGYEIRVNDVAQFREGLRIEVKGSLQTDGSVSVSRIKDETEDSVRTEDQVVSVDTGTGSFTTRLGIVITPKERTRLEDDISDIDNPSISSFLNIVNNNISNNHRIEARGYPGDGSTIWTRLEISDDNDSDCSLRGRVANISGNSTSFTFEIEGVTINLTDVSESNFKDGSSLVIGKSVFFDQLTEGDIVEAESIKTGGGCTTDNMRARQVEFEPENNVLLGSSSSSSSSTGGSTSSSNELNGPVSNVTLTSFVVAGETISVNAATVIDNSLIEDARNANVDDDAAFGTLTDLTLDDLLGSGLAVQVVVDRSSGSAVAVSIENI